MLYYFPLEPIPERYTSQLAAPDSGWSEAYWKRRGIQYQRLEGPDPSPKSIKRGSVVDAVRRPIWAFHQVEALLSKLEDGQITSHDVLYFDDFWHPGIEALAYAFDQFKVRPRMYARLWAQSVDRFDFTQDMLPWIRDFEIGIGNTLDGVFVANTLLKELVVEGRLSTRYKTLVAGLPFDSAEVLQRMPQKPWKRENKVVFSSRMDWEKNPSFFIQVAREVKKQMDAKFVITSSAPELRSNKKEICEEITDAQRAGIIEVKTGLSKGEYYKELTTAKVQFNSALQDWVSFTLLEATVAGAYPIYPDFRSFPETLEYNRCFLYRPGEIKSAAGKVLGVLKAEDLWTDEAIQDRSWIYKRHDKAIEKQAMAMGLLSSQEFREVWGWYEPRQ